jgi:hypothetical protein
VTITDDICAKCGAPMLRLRQAQRYCSIRCRMADAYRRRRSVDKTLDASPDGRSVDAAVDPLGAGLRPYVWPTPPRGLEEPKLNPDGSTPGAVYGNYPLDYYPCALPVLPECLRRRRK